MKAFEEKVLSTIQRYNMVDTEERVLVAVSGGLDSMTLLTVLRRIPLHLDLSVFHLNHGLRPEAKEEAKLVADVCRKWSIPCRIIEIKLKEIKGSDSLQVTARNERYKLLEETAQEKGVTKIALGHHTDDQVETMLMRFLNGAGPQGMAGIPPVRDKYIRPFFEVTRDEIREYAREMGLLWAEDVSNQKIDYFRNKIRHRLIPVLLKEYQPRLKKRLMESAYIFQEWEEFILMQVAQVLQNWGLQKNPDEIRMPISNWSVLPFALKRAVFREVFFRIAPGIRLEYKHSVIFFDLLEGENGKRVFFPAGLEAVKEKDMLIIRPVKKKVAAPSFYLSLNIPGRTLLPFEQGRIEAIKGNKDLLPKKWQEVSSAEAFFDYEAITLPLYIRSRRVGDRFNPLGLKGSKKIKDFFSDYKVSKDERDLIPILVDGEGRVLWIVGMRSAENGRVTENTKNVLYLKYYR